MRAIIKLMRWWNRDRIAVPVAEGRGLSLQIGQRVLIQRRLLTIKSRTIDGELNRPSVHYTATEGQRIVQLVAATEPHGVVKISILKSGASGRVSRDEWLCEDAISIVNAMDLQTARMPPVAPTDADARSRTRIERT